MLQTHDSWDELACLANQSSEVSRRRSRSFPESFLAGKGSGRIRVKHGVVHAWRLEKHISVVAKTSSQNDMVSQCWARHLLSTGHIPVLTTPGFLAGFPASGRPIWFLKPSSWAYNSAYRFMINKCNNMALACLLHSLTVLFKDQHHSVFSDHELAIHGGLQFCIRSIGKCQGKPTLNDKTLCQFTWSAWSSQKNGRLKMTSLTWMCWKVTWRKKKQWWSLHHGQIYRHHFKQTQCKQRSGANQGNIR